MIRRIISWYKIWILKREINAKSKPLYLKDKFTPPVQSGVTLPITERVPSY